MKTKLNKYDICYLVLLVYILIGNLFNILINIGFLIFYTFFLFTVCNHRKKYNQLSIYIFLILIISTQLMGWNRGFYPLYLLILFVTILSLLIILQIKKKSGYRYFILLFITLLAYFAIRSLLQLLIPTIAYYTIINSFIIIYTLVPILLIRELIFLEEEKEKKFYFLISFIPIFFEISFPIGSSLMYLEFGREINLETVFYKIFHLFVFSANFLASKIKLKKKRVVLITAILLVLNFFLLFFSFEKVSVLITIFIIILFDYIYQFRNQKFVILDLIQGKKSLSVKRILSLLVLFSSILILIDAIENNQAFKIYNQQMDNFLIEKTKSIDVVDNINTYCGLDVEIAEPNIFEYYKYRNIQYECKVFLGYDLTEILYYHDDNSSEKIYQEIDACFERAENIIPIKNETDSKIGPYQEFLSNCFSLLAK